MINKENHKLKVEMSAAYSLVRSPKEKKKWRITTPSGKRVDFGQAGASDFTIHGDEERKIRYLVRHGGDAPDFVTSHSRENWSDPNTAGFWSRWLTWNKPTIAESIADIENRFGIKVIDGSADGALPRIA